MKKKLTVTQDAETPVEVSVLAKSIVDISQAAKRLTQSGLNRKAVIVLIAHSSGISQRDVRIVLEHMEYLQSAYLNQK